jgi:hypothetical protein
MSALPTLFPLHAKIDLRPQYGKRKNVPQSILRHFFWDRPFWYLLSGEASFMSTATICSYSIIHCSSYGNDSHPDDLVKSNEQLRQHPDSLSNHAMTNPHIQGWLTTP